jgi:hypothetical protein
MNASELSATRFVQPSSTTDSFQAWVNQQPLNVTSLLAASTLRPELGIAPSHWICKVIAEGKVAGKRASIGLFFDRNLLPGTYDILANPQINFVYSQTPHCKSVIYHSAHFQAGHLTLLESDIPGQRLQGQFSFSISAINFAVTDGAFDVHCQPF